VTRDVIDDAVDELRRRAARSDRDTSSTVDHFVRTVRPICEQWRLTTERWLEGGAGTPTLAVTTPEGRAGVLKIAEPGELDAAASVMRADEGRGYARVLAWDRAHGALLTERLGDVLGSAAPTLVAQGAITLSLLKKAWQVPLGFGLPFEGKASGLLRILTNLGPRYGAAYPPALARARSYAAELAASERPEVVCHGDPHPGNVLRRDDGWALIDPDGFVGERSYDVGVVLRDGCAEIAAAESSQPGSGVAVLRDACQRLAVLADVDPERVWRWAFVERVTTGLYLHWHGYADEATRFLDIAAIVDQDPTATAPLVPYVRGAANLQSGECP
jgi:streptomycin 6-kinase